MSGTDDLFGGTKRLNTQIAQKLRELRIMHRVSQAELGKVLGVSFQQIQKYENAANRISVRGLVQVAEFFDVSVMTFFEDLDKRRSAQNKKIDTSTMRVVANLNAIRDQKAKTSLMKLIHAVAKSEEGDTKD